MNVVVNSSAVNWQVGKVGKRSAPPLQRSVLSLATRTAQPIKAYLKNLEEN